MFETHGRKQELQEQHCFELGAELENLETNFQDKLITALIPL